MPSQKTNKQEQNWSIHSLSESQGRQTQPFRCLQQKCSFVCINQNCQNNPFLCINNLCKCQDDHIGCLRGQISSIKQKISHKKSFHHIQKTINNEIERQIQYLSNILKFVGQQYIQTTKEICKKNDFSQMEKNILKAFQTGQPNGISGKVISQICVTDHIQSKLNSYFSKFHQQLKVLTTQIFELKNVLKPKQVTQLNPQIHIQQKVGNFVVVDKNIIKNSSIINSSQSYCRLLNLLPKQVLSLRLIFKASDHNFSMKKYYQLCGSQTNTIIACLNSNDKIIGGYTPLSFDPKQSDSCWVEDLDNQSFVFSLTTNQKFTLKNKQQAIRRWGDRKFISFGWMFDICDRANMVNSSCFSFQSNSYHTLHYSQDKQSHFKVIGSQKIFFTIKEWEVFKVELSE